MRIALVLAAVALTLAPPVAGQERSRFIVPNPPAKETIALRGAQPVSAAPAAPLAPAAPTDPELADPIGGAASVKWTVKPDRSAVGQCRSSCDRSYYGCLSGDDAAACPTSWSQCRAKCERRRS